ncbi:MAG: phosphoribosylglycinamide formyltransferase [Verrucomicrobiota bacterium]
MKSDTSPPLRLGILGSGRGSNFVALYDAIHAGKVNATIQLVATDLADAPILSEAKNRNLRTYATPRSQFKTKLETEIETELAEQLIEAGVELVVLAGFMRVVKSPLLEAFPSRIINVHPSLLPKFKGLEAWKQALLAGEKESGCSVHWVNEVLDGGSIIAQQKVPILEDDTPESLHQRIQVQEHQLLPEVIQQMAMGKINLA